MAKQEMSFKKLYVDSKSKIAETVINMWKENSPKMVEKYAEQLKDIISKCISDNIVVENMAHWEPAANDDDWRKVVNEKIWSKKDKDGNIVANKFRPYKHQYESWKTLLNDNKSIVVTSGTGSGKTECFMVPLVHDLTKEQNNDVPRKQAVEALFLYPLNALMEDQKQRMDNYIAFSGKDLKFAVYNGNTPEDENSPKYDNSSLYKNEILTRREIRAIKPNILFTNPSMLEYMLLRKVDSDLFTSELKWIVIDETHTYKGSAGAELAMLIRRVLKACGKTADEIKFATSSATIGSGDEAKSKLKEFISQITGQSQDKIEVIEGRRTDPNVDDEHIKESLKERDFVLLKELIKEGSVEDKLAKLDELADNGLRVRLHYYLQTLNMGLFVDPRKTEDGQFVLSNTIPLEEGKLDKHYLDAYYCKECGAVLGFGEMDNDHMFSRKIQEEVASLEDYAEEDGDSNDGSANANGSSNSLPEFYVGINDNNEKNPNVGLWAIDETGDKFENKGGNFKIKPVELNKKNEVIHYCPCCAAHGNGKNKPMRSFHMSADYISRLIAPILLEQTSPANENPETLPCQGRKYITFADSRQSAAGPTLKQNLETEEVWVTGVLYNELIKGKGTIENDINYLNEQIESGKRYNKLDDVEKHKKELEPLLNKKENGYYLTWSDALNVLHKDKNFKRMFLAFAKPDDRNDKKSENEYALSALYRVMARNGANGKNSPENWGLICTHYPALDNLKNRTLPVTIENFNNRITDENLKITDKDWYDYVKIFIDYDIRRHERFFFKYEVQSWDEIDYSVTRQYRTGVSNRRPIDGEESKMQVGDNRYTKLLLNLLDKTKCAELNIYEKEIVSGVIGQLKIDLKECGIKEVGQELNWVYEPRTKRYVLGTNKWRNSENEPHYMNLSRIAFKLYDDKVWFDDNLRIPVSTTFKGYSPERSDNQKYDVKCEKIDWKPYNKNEESKTWFEENRKPILHKWTSKLEQILDYSDNNNTLYVQAEHTAQVARSIIKEKTDEFKKGEINIMACSTTMEMGVDLGDLELVLMNNVPPHPANYKQRAGRAGRGDQNKSASVTICGCDASGNALMQNPLKNLICAPIEPPKVDLTSPQLIQRHVNSYLLRKYFNENGIRFNPGTDTENDNGYKLYKFFTRYSDIGWDQQKEACYFKEPKGDSILNIFPKDYVSITTQLDPAYNEFISKIDGYATDSSVIAEVKSLVKDTFKVESDAVALILNTKYTIEKIAKDLDEELAKIKEIWNEKKCNVNEKNDYVTNPWKRLNYSFTSILRKNLLSYLSTHQFTPNANMPVGIVEMVIDDNERHSTENPSRDMRTALSEYAPGRMVFINGVTYLMGGIKWNHSQGNQNLRICSNGHTWLGETEECPKCKQSAIDIDGFGKYMDVMTPTGFYPYKDTSRITQKDAISLVLDTALIGVGNWKSNPDDQRLYMIRTNEDSTNSQILYYNKGLGRGYYVCKECGYAVPVPQNSNASLEEIQKCLYPIEGKNKKEFYHNYRGWKCGWKDGSDALPVLKNVVFGGAMQTDYCEIALFDNATQRMQYSETNNQVAYTLGLMLCREFAKRKNCDGSEFDFIVRRQDGNLSICIFDTAKGGVGYSKSINGHVIDELFDRIREMLKDCTSADKILDRTTMRKYADLINVTATYEWLDSEYKFRKIVPEKIKNQLPNARVSCYSEVESAIKNIQAGEQCALFFNGKEINRWNYNERDVNWLSNRSCLNKDYPQQKTFAVYNISTQIASSDKNKMNMSSGGNEWKRIDNPLGDMFPIAQVGRTLYFTDKKEYSVLNGIWASGYVYSVDYNPIDLNNLNVVEIGDDHYTFKEDDRNNRKSDSLFGELYGNSDKLQEFITACKGHKLSFTYHEEYLRTHLGMTITLQFIQKFAEKAKSQIKLIKIVGEEYDDSRLYNDWNYDTDEQPNKLYINCLNHDKRDDYVIGVFLEPMLNNEEFEEYEVESVQEGRLPHWRALIVKDETTGAVINILPNGGFANGWEFDNREFKQGGWFPSNCDIDTAIPIKISDSNGLLYDIKVGELK